MAILTKVAGTWQEVEEVPTRIAGGWVGANAGLVKVAGAWQEVFRETLLEAVLTVGNVGDFFPTYGFVRDVWDLQNYGTLAPDYIEGRRVASILWSTTTLVFVIRLTGEEPLDFKSITVGTTTYLSVDATATIYQGIRQYTWDDEENPFGTTVGATREVIIK